jgi:hypothetical protein
MTLYSHVLFNRYRISLRRMYTITLSKNNNNFLRIDSKTERALQRRDNDVRNINFVFKLRNVCVNKYNWTDTILLVLAPNVKEHYIFIL